MKKLLPIIVFLLVTITAISQIRPSDSLYLWVDFSDDRIMIDIPDSYMHYRNLPPMLPNHVRVRQLNTFVPNLPAKPALIAMLQQQLQQTRNPQTREQQLKYLGKIVLLLFYSQNNPEYLTDKYTGELIYLAQDSMVRNEASLVKKWVQMIKDQKWGKSPQTLNHLFRINPLIKLLIGYKSEFNGSFP